MLKTYSKHFNRRKFKFLSEIPLVGKIEADDEIK